MPGVVSHPVRTHGDGDGDHADDGCDGDDEDDGDEEEEDEAVSPVKRD